MPWTAILGLGIGIGSASCQVLPPPARVDARMGVVRAGSLEEAGEVARSLDALFPAVLAELPDARMRVLEVWVQKNPELYAFPPSSAYRDADGFFSERLNRIHLRESSDDVERTLAHELVHASLGRSWRGLPGTIEEGLCDVVAARLCPRSAPRLRAGRLLAAALAVGGLDIEVKMGGTTGSQEIGSEISFIQRILPAGHLGCDIDPLEVFRTRAGTSNSLLESDRKKALYGLAFLVAERIIERRGIEGLHDLVCASNASTAAENFLAAAELSHDPLAWRRALASALGPAEFVEIAREHPGLLLSPPVGELTSSSIDRPRERLAPDGEYGPGQP